MNEHSLNELGDALSTLRTDIAVAIPWNALYRWFGANRLAPPHYAEVNRLWAQTWIHAGESRPVPTVYLYHGADKLTLVREATFDDPPAIELQVLGSAVLDAEG